MKEAIEAGGSNIEFALSKIIGDTMLKRQPLMQEIADALVFLASDRASGITGTTIDVTCGTTGALNSRPDAHIKFVS